MDHGHSLNAMVVIFFLHLGKRSSASGPVVPTYKSRVELGRHTVRHDDTWRLHCFHGFLARPQTRRSGAFADGSAW